jgi:ATP phosphoribosyltransferase regulatory subunit
MRYYDGIVFKGFLNGISEAVLSGGAYDPLMKRMNRRSRAIGFALYLDALEELEGTRAPHDIDVLLIYGDKTEAESVIKTKNKIISEGKTVYAAKAIPKKIRFSEIVYLDKEAGEI